MLKKRNFRVAQFIEPGKLVSVLLVAVLSVSLFTGCAKKEPEVYKIGVIGPLTGEGTSYGEAMQKGINLAIEEINEKGGINGVKLMAIYRDSKLTPKEAINAFRYLVSKEKTAVIMGAAASSISLTLAPLANKEKTVLYSSISTADELRDAGDYFFRNVPPNSNQAKTAAYFVKNYLKKTSVAILYENNDYGANIGQVFAKYFAEINGKVVAHNSYESGQKDFRSVLSKIKTSNSEVIYIPGTYEGNALILRQARNMGIKAQFMGGDGAYSPELTNIAGSSAEGFYCTLMSIPDSQESMEVRDFFKIYREKYNEDPNVYATYSFDAMNMVAQAIEKGGYTGEGIKNALSNLVYSGITGSIQFDKYGEVDKPYSIYVVKNGEFKPSPWTPKF